MKFSETITRGHKDGAVYQIKHFLITWVKRSLENN